MNRPARIALAASVALAGMSLAVGSSVTCEAGTTGFCAITDGPVLAAWDMTPTGSEIDVGPAYVLTYHGLNTGAMIGYGRWCVGVEVIGSPGVFWRLPTIGGDAEC